MSIPHLSPYVQYYVRKILRQYVTCFNYPLAGIGIHHHLQTNLNQLMRELYTNEFELQLKVQELEALIHLHQHGNVKEIAFHANLPEIEQKVLWILGLKFLALLPAMSVTVIAESAAALFHFVLDDELHQGIRYADELYGKALEFGAEQDFATYRLLMTLINQQIPFILTVSEFRHAIWVSLRAPAYDALIKQEPLLQKTA